MSGVDQVLLALFLFLTMLGMGATLAIDDFLRVCRRPAPLLVGLLCQFGWMPAIAWALARGLDFADPVALGLVVMGCSAGGTTSNLFSYWARADLALSISMTVLSTLAAVAVMPLVLFVYGRGFQGDALTIPYANIVTTLVAVLVPVGLGVALRARSERAAKRAERFGSLAGILVLLGVIGSSVYRDAERALDFTGLEVLAALLLGPAGFAFGNASARLLRRTDPERRAIALETGIQNAPLAYGIILASFPAALADEILRVPLLYGVLVVPASAALALRFRRR